MKKVCIWRVLDFGFGKQRKQKSDYRSWWLLSFSILKVYPSSYSEIWIDLFKNLTLRYRISVYIRLFIRSFFCAKNQQKSAFLRKKKYAFWIKIHTFLNLIPWHCQICRIFNRNYKNKDFGPLILTKFSHVYVYLMLYAY